MNFLSKKSIFLVLLHLLLVTLRERVGLYLQGGIPWSVGIIPAGPERPEQGALTGPVPQLVFVIVESLPELRRSGAMGALQEPRQDRHGRGSCQSLLVLGALCSCGAASSAQGSPRAVALQGGRALLSHCAGHCLFSELCGCCTGTLLLLLVQSSIFIITHHGHYFMCHSCLLFYLEIKALKLVHNCIFLVSVAAAEVRHMLAFSLYFKANNIISLLVLPFNFR